VQGSGTAPFGRLRTQGVLSRGCDAAVGVGVCARSAGGFCSAPSRTDVRRLARRFVAIRRAPRSRGLTAQTPRAPAFLRAVRGSGAFRVPWSEPQRLLTATIDPVARVETRSFTINSFHCRCPAARFDAGGGG